MDPSSSSSEPTPNFDVSDQYQLPLLLSQLVAYSIPDQMKERGIAVAKPKAENMREGNPQNEIVVLYAHILRVARQAKENVDTHVWEEILVPEFSKNISPGMAAFFATLMSNKNMDKENLKIKVHNAILENKTVPMIEGLDTWDAILQGMYNFIDNPSPAEFSNAELHRIDARLTNERTQWKVQVAVTIAKERKKPFARLAEENTDDNEDELESLSFDDIFGL